MAYHMLFSFDRFDEKSGYTYEITVDGKFYHYPSEFDDFKLSPVRDEHLELDLYVAKITKFDEENRICWKREDLFIGPVEPDLPIVGVTHVDHLPQAEQDSLAERAWNVFLDR